VKILVVDDHVLVCEGVKCLFAAHQDIEVYGTTRMHDALALYHTKSPDVVLLDFNMPHSTGFETLTRLLIEDRRAKIIMFSMYTEPIYVARTLNAGARGYISKNASGDELLEAVQVVAAGGCFVEPSVATQLVVSRLDGGDPLDRLTTRELAIVRLLRQGKSRDEISFSLGISYKTVANTLSIIKSKLGIGHDYDLARVVSQIGDAAMPSLEQ
jgi:two-component system, NarL family, invasion response regulator UvrY